MDDFLPVLLFEAFALAVAAIALTLAAIQRRWGKRSDCRCETHPDLREFDRNVNHVMALMEQEPRR